MESYNDLFLQMVSKLDDFSFLGPILTKFQLCLFSGLFWAFSHVKRAKNKIAKGQQKECSNQKIEENKSCLEFNFLWKSKCASPNFEIWVLAANLTEPLIMKFFKKILPRVNHTSDKLRSCQSLANMLCMAAWREKRKETKR